MALCSLQEPVIATDSELNGASFTGVSIRDCNIAGLRVEGYLVSDLIAAYRKSV
jgi:hypothetical protein